MTASSEDNNDHDESSSPKGAKRKERLEQNRVSARESRKRKKGMIEELQRTVITLSRENKDLHDRNETLRRQLLELGSKYPSLVPLHAIMGQQVPPQIMAPGTTGLEGASMTTNTASAAVDAANATGV